MPSNGVAATESISSSPGRTGCIFLRRKGRSEFKIYTDISNFCKEIGIPIVGPPEESFYPQGMFIDTLYHIDEIGQRIRTDKLDPPPAHTFGIPPPSGPKTLCVMASRYSVVNEKGVFPKGRIDHL